MVGEERKKWEEERGKEERNKKADFKKMFIVQSAPN